MYVPQYPKKIIEKAANQWLKNNPELRRSIVNLGAIAINTDANVRDLKILLDNKLGTIFHRSHFDEWMNGYNCCEVDPVIEYEDSCIAYMSKYYDFDLKPYVKEIHQFLFFTPLLNKRNPQCWRFLSNYYLAKGGIDATDNLYTPASVFRWVLIIIFFEILIPPEPFMRDAPHFFYRKYNKNLL